MNDRSLYAVGGLVLSIVGVVMVCWALAPLVWRLAVALAGIWLIMYGIRMRKGGMSFIHAYSRFSGRSFR